MCGTKKEMLVYAVLILAVVVIAVALIVQAGEWGKGMGDQGRGLCEKCGSEPAAYPKRMEDVIPAPKRMRDGSLGEGWFYL